MSTYYRVAVTDGQIIDETGAYLRDAIAYDCGHNHRTEAAAEACQTKLVGYNKRKRTCSAKWYNSAIVETDVAGRHVPTPALTMAEIAAIEGWNCEVRG